MFEFKFLRIEKALDALFGTNDPKKAAFNDALRSLYENSRNKPRDGEALSPRSVGRMLVEWANRPALIGNGVCVRLTTKTDTKKQGVFWGLELVDAPAQEIIFDEELETSGTIDTTSKY